MIDFSCLGVKVNGRMKVLDEGAFTREWKQIGEGEEFEIHFSDVSHEPKHTRAQEKFFHGPVLKAFMTLGMGKEEAKAVLCLRFIPLEVHDKVTGSVTTVPGSTKKLGRKAYSDLIEECIQLAAELNLIIEDADEWRRKNRAA